MRVIKSNALLSIANSYICDSPQPINISYAWNFGSLLALCLGTQILTGVILAMHYTPNIDLAFISVEHIMRDVNYGWMIRYIHANTASFFFIFVYLHIARGLYFGSYKSPRILPWSVGVIILVLMMGTAFLGYVLPYGQMSLWGISNCPTCSNTVIYAVVLVLINVYLRSGMLAKRISAISRVGPHNITILSIITGSLLGDGHAEQRVQGNGTRITFYQAGSHIEYLLWLHELISSLGYCSPITPVIQTRVDNGITRYVIRFRTYTYSSFNFIFSDWYVNGIKIVPANIAMYLTPLALAIWMMVVELVTV